MKAKLGACLLGVALALGAPPLAAQPADEATRTAARALGTAGVEAYQANDFAMATDKLEKAYGILRAPSLGLWSGRALVKVGKLVEAADRFLEVTSLQVPSGEYAVQKQAQTDAQAELQVLRPRIPSVVVQIEGATAAECTVSLDGQPVSSSLLAEGRLVNPGHHVVDGRRGSDVAHAEVSVAEGEHSTALLKFSVAVAPAAVTPVAGPPAAPAASPASAPAAPGKAEKGSGWSQRTWGWVSLGAGGVGLGLAAITGGLAIGKKGELDASPNCHADVCSSSEAGAVNSYVSLKTVSAVGLYGGAGLAALGVVLLITAPSDAKVQAFLGPTSAVVRGRF